MTLDFEEGVTQGDSDTDLNHWTGDSYGFFQPENYMEREFERNQKKP